MKERLIAVAEGEIGQAEPMGDNKYIEYYNKTGGMDFSMTVPWCAIFVTWCKAMAGIEKSVIPHFASCDVGMEWFKKKKLWQKGAAYGGEYTPKRGDIVFFSSKYDEKDSTHVGIVTSVSGNTVSTIEGNSSDMVRRRSYLGKSKYILGYGTPEYVKGYRPYRVKKGDNLWKIAKNELGSGERYPEIMKINEMTDTVIYPDEVIYLP